MALQHVADFNQLEESKPLLVEIKGRSIGLIRAGEKVYAVRNLCPHKRAPICKGTMSGTMMPSDPDTFVFGMEQQVLRCPWHGWEFNLETGQTLCPSKSRLTLYPVTREGDAVYLDL
jgi:nitrite reductase/ring-hydroxylating ferredoxin subunit